jgi:bifunctional N-acetylglutamate synthase/kinase
MTSKGKETQDVIARLLTNIGSRKEVEQYLRYYTNADAPKFAVVKVSGALVDRSLDALASSMAFLARVGLVPIVVHGGNVQLDRALEQAGFDVPVVRGLRKMTPATLEIARRVLHDANLRLVEALESLGTRARPFTSGVLDARKVESAELGLIGEIAAVREAAIAQTAASGVLPIVAPLGETAKGQILVIHADKVASAIAQALEPHKVIFLNEVGGLVDGTGAIRSAVNLAEDYDELVAEGSLGPEARHKLIEIKELLSHLPPAASASITSPEHLAKELFTHGGHGTFVRRGEKVVCHDAWDAVDLPRLRALLETCFARRLDDAYFEQKNPYRIYLAESYRATAILTMEHRGAPGTPREHEGVPYLDKFAVTNEAQGEGIGGSIWQRLRRENEKLFWRSRANNPINAWYAQKADGLYKSDKWWVFWCGMSSFSEIQPCVENALAMKATFLDALSSSPPPADTAPRSPIAGVP